MADTTHIQMTPDCRFYARTLNRIVGWNEDGEALSKSQERIVGSAQGEGAETVWDMGEPDMPFQYWSDARQLQRVAQAIDALGVNDARLLADCLTAGLITEENAYVKQAREQKLPPFDKKRRIVEASRPDSDIAVKDGE
jgi:hypothetical protein